MSFFNNSNQNRRGQNQPVINTTKTVLESEMIRKVPYLGTDFLTNCLLRVVVTRSNIGKLLTACTHNIYFTTAYVLAVLGVFNYLRYYYRDQFRAYGLYDHSPGLAEQLQPQNVATFNFVTLPTALEKAKLLVPPEETLPNQLTKFSITPFVDRVDVYPESLLIQFNDAWAELMGRNFFITYPHPAPQDPHVLPQWGFASTRPLQELQSKVPRTDDPWFEVRGLVESLDEFPTHVEQAILPVPSADISSLVQPAPVQIIGRWQTLTDPAQASDAGTSSISYRVVPSSALTTLLNFQPAGSQSHPYLVGSAVNLPQSALIQEFFDAEVPRPAQHDPWTVFKTSGIFPEKRAFSKSAPTTGQTGSSTEEIGYATQLTQTDWARLQNGPLAPLGLPEPPTPPFTRTGTRFRRKTAASRWEMFRGDARAVGEALKSVLGDLGQALFPVKKQVARPKYTTLPTLKTVEPETPLEAFEREAAKKRLQEERRKFIASRSDSFQAYIKSIRNYRAKLRDHNLQVKRLKQRFEAKERVYNRAMGRANDVELFWQQTLPDVILSNINALPPTAANSWFVADSTFPSNAAWDRVERLLWALSQDTDGVAPTTVTGRGVRNFIQLVLQNSNVPCFDYASQPRQVQKTVGFIPYDMLAVPYPEQLIEDLQQYEAQGGYQAFYDVLAQMALSAGSAESAPTRFNLKVKPTDQHFQPIIAWINEMQSNEGVPTTPIVMPPGNEYHWAHAMQRVLSTEEGVRELLTVLQKHAPQHSSSYAFTLETLQAEIDAYLASVHQLEMPASSDMSPLALEYARRLADLNAFTACYADLRQSLYQSLDHGLLRDDARALAAFMPVAYPHMNGYAFPDYDGEELETQWHAAARRYNLTQHSAWHNFKTMTQRRPVEVGIPAGYRPYMEDVFSATTREEEQQVNFIPKYVCERLLAYYPAYSDLQKVYGDLDVSFLPEKPLPKAFISKYNPDEQAYEAELNPIELRKRYYFQFNRALLRSPLTGDVYADDRFTFSTTVRDFFQYVLSPANWLKDRPANFRGQAARLLPDPTNRARDQHQIILGQMGAYPEFTQDADLLEVSKHAVAARKQEFPLKLHGYRREFFFTNNFEELSADEKDSLFEKHLLHKSLMDIVQGKVSRRYGWRMWMDNARETSQLEVEDDVYLPRLTMDEWHSLFKTCLQTAKETNDPDFLLDMPVLLLQGAGVSQPSGFDGVIYKGATTSKVLTQVLMAITQHNYGAYDFLGYDNMVNTLNYQDQQVRFGRRPKLIPHFEMPKDELQSEPTGAPTWMESSSWRIPSHGIGRWKSAEDYILEMTGQKQKSRDWSRVTGPIRAFLQKLPGGKNLTRRHVFHDNVEPITPYWWCYGGKLVFYAWLYRMFWFMWGTSWEELKLILLDNFGGRRLRALFVDLGIENQFTYRVIVDNPNTFRSSAGALNNELFVHACESVAHLRNKCRPGTFMPKGLLLTGVPGTGKTYMVQMIAGESGVPVITQTAGELFNKRNFADLDMEQCFTPAEQLGFVFDRARRLAPCILFIDEIDAIGESRENVMTSTLDKSPNPGVDLYGYLRVKHTPLHKPLTPKLTLKERELLDLFTKRTVEAFRKDRRKLLTYEQYPGAEPVRTGEIFVYKDEMLRREMQQVGALTEFLVQMDGLEPLEGVLVIGATNRVQVLDPAIMRPGRLEQVIELFPPGARERLEIFQKECHKIGVVSGISWNYLVNRTRGLTVANLTTAINHSAIRAININSPHTLETLEYGLDTMLRHKRAVKMIATRQMPDPKTVRSRDPYLFTRVAYYQAGRALLHNILPDHPSLPFVKLAVEPFEPEYRIRDLFLHNYNRTELEIRLIGLHAGKAAEYVMLYDGKPEGILPTALHLLESDQGADELAFASELANAMVDEWFLYEDTRLPIRMQPRSNDNARNYNRPIDIESRESMEYWVNVHSKSFARLHSERDQPPIDANTKSYPPGHTIYERFEELAYWATAVSRIELNAITKDYIQWYNYYLRQPFRHERSRFWIPPDLYFHEDPATFIDFDEFMEFVQQSDTDWASLRKSWEEQVRDWDPTGKMLPESKRPTMIFPDWHLVDRDYIMQSLMGVSFETALNVLNEFRPLLDVMAKHLLKFKILRQDDIDIYIRQYTEARVQADLPTPIDLADFSNTETLPGLKNNIPPVMAPSGQLPPLIAPIDYMRPDEEFVLTEDNQFLVYERSWGPASRRPYGKKIPLSYFDDKELLQRRPPVRDDLAGWEELPEPTAGLTLFEGPVYMGPSPPVSGEEGGDTLPENSPEDQNPPT